MKLHIQGNRLYADNVLFSHCEVKDGFDNKPFNGTVEPRYSHHAGRELVHADGLGWVGGDASCAVVVGRVVSGDGAILPCRLTETRLMTMVNMADELGQHVTLEVAHG